MQLFIAVSMIILMLEEARARTDEMCDQIRAVRSEKETLQVKIISAEDKFRNLFGQTALQGDLQVAYEQLRETQQTVVQQERLRALGQMASGIAHDINNSLTPIIGYSDFLLDPAIGYSRGQQETPPMRPHGRGRHRAYGRAGSAILPPS